MTETACIARMTPWPEHDHTGSSGRPATKIDMKLVDDEGKDVTAYNVIGEICFRGPVVMSGYFENAKPKAFSMPMVSSHIGDIGHCDSKTKSWYIVGRKKELVEA